MSLTPKQQRFVEEYLVDLNATQAAIRAGYSERSAYAIGEQNLRKHEVKEAIQQAMAQRSERTQVTADMIVLELLKVGMVDPRRLFNRNGKMKAVTELDDDTAASLASLEVSEESSGSGDDKKPSAFTKKVKLWNKVEALKLLGQHVGMFKDVREHTGNVNFRHSYDDLSDAEVEQRIRDLESRQALSSGGEGSPPSAS